MVKVIIPNGDTEDHRDAQSFGVTQGGDLILVALMDAPVGPGVPPGAKVGNNLIAYAKGEWKKVIIEKSQIQEVTAIVEGGAFKPR